MTAFRAKAANAMSQRKYFGTDGVRGIVGEAITPELVDRLGKAVALWSGRGRVFIGRDTRASGNAWIGSANGSWTLRKIRWAPAGQQPG